MKITTIFILFLLISDLFLPAFAQEIKKKTSSGVNKQVKIKTVNPDKNFTMVKSKDMAAPDITWSSEDEEELIPINVRNEFDEEIKVKFDTNREYPIGPNEGISLGKRKPGRYTLTIYNKNGDFVDNVTRTVDKNNKFVLNKDTVENADKITGLSTGQKVAITAGAIGAAAIGTALVNKALQENENQEQYVPSSVQEIIQPPVQVFAEALPQDESLKDINNAIAPGGMGFKFLNAKHEQVTLIIEGSDGNPIGNNWVIPKSQTLLKPQSLIFNGEKILINPNQKITVVLPNGFELVRYAFELEIDSDGNFFWIVNR